VQLSKTGFTICCGSRKGGKLRAKGQTKRNVPLTTTKHVSNILCESVALQRKERQRDEFGNKSFLLSFLPLMDNLPSELTVEARHKITEVFKNVSAATPVSVSTNKISISWTSIAFSIPDFENTNHYIM
jgi:hypothetical protein